MVIRPTATPPVKLGAPVPLSPDLLESAFAAELAELVPVGVFVEPMPETGFTSDFVNGAA